MPDPLNMASSGKKNKKSKGKTLSLNTFLQETPGTVPAIPIRKAPSNWADEVEDTYDTYDGRGPAKPTNVVLPTAPKAARGLDDISDKIPQNPPYKVYLSNLPYDIDEEEIADFFSNLKITNMRVPREERIGEPPRARGYSYVEFADRESLIQALEIPECTLKGRRIRIEVATNTDNDRRRNRMDMNRDRPDRPEAPTGDWRSGGRKEPDGPERRYREGGGRDFNRDRNREGGEERSGGMWRDGGDRPAFKDRENNDRFREDRPITRDQPPRYDSNERRAFGPRRDRDDRPFERSDRTFDRGERNGGGFRRPDEGGEQRTRPKLNLAPRTVPTNNPAPTTEAANDNKLAADQPPKPSAGSIFGSAKPVDTTAREREIEERLAKQSENDKKDDDRFDRRRDEGRRRSPDRRRSPERRRYSPRRSPRRDSRERPERDSPEPRHGSQDRRRGGSSDRSQRSPDRFRRSPDRNRRSPERRRGSPDRRRDSNERGRRDDNRRYNERNSSRDNKPRTERRPPREYTERELPKVKTPEPINIVGPNKYAFLENEDDD